MRLSINREKGRPSQGDEEVVVVEVEKKVSERERDKVRGRGRESAREKLLKRI